MMIEYDDLTNLIDRRIADSLERIEGRLDFDVIQQLDLRREVEWLREP